MATSPITFEGNDLSEFDATVTDSGDLAAAGGDAALYGSYGMAATIDDTNVRRGRITSVSNWSHLRFGFYFDPNGISMGSGNEFVIAAGNGGNSEFLLFLKYDGSNYQLMLKVYTDSSSSKTSYVTITDDKHWVEVEMERSTGAGNDDGYGQFWVDDVSGAADASTTGLDDDTEDFDELDFGATESIDAGISGTLYFDQLTWNNTGASIGPPAAGTSVPPLEYHYRHH